MKRYLIFCGKLGSGKSTVSKGVASKIGANWNGFGVTVKNIAMERGLPTDRDHLQSLGAQLVNELPEYFCNKVLKDAGYPSSQVIVLDGLRHESCLTLLRKMLAPKDLLCIYVDVEEKIRFDRIAKRDGSNIERVNELDKHSTEIEVERTLRPLSDFIVDNSGDAESAIKKVLNWLDLCSASQ